MEFFFEPYFDFFVERGKQTTHLIGISMIFHSPTLYLIQLTTALLVLFCMPIHAQKRTVQAESYKNDILLSRDEQYVWGDTTFYIHYSNGSVQCIKRFERANSTLLAVFEYSTGSNDIASAPSFSAFRSPIKIHSCSKEDGYPSTVLRASSSIQETGEIQFQRTSNSLTSIGLRPNIRFEWNRDELTEWEEKSTGVESEIKWTKTATVKLNGQHAQKEDAKGKIINYYVSDSKNFVRNYIELQTFFLPVGHTFLLFMHDLFPILEETDENLSWSTQKDSKNRIIKRSAVEERDEKKNVYQILFSYGE